MQRPPLIAISAGDPAGVGPSVSFEAAARASDEGLCFPVVFSHPAAVPGRYRRGKQARRLAPAQDARGLAAARWRPGTIGVVDVLPGTGLAARPGLPTADGARAALASLALALDAARRGPARALVTAPVSKEQMARVAEFPGHTEWLARRCGIDPSGVVMAFFGERARVATVTRHLPLRDVPSSLSAAAVARTTLLVCAGLFYDLGVKKPRVAVGGLNPHAGEGGLLGDEEERLILPGVRDAIGIAMETEWGREALLVGPLPADAMMRMLAVGGIDAAVAMYHDQAMIAAKALEPAGSPGCTLGLPVVRTTPSHGTAYDAAREESADPRPMEAALRLAVRIARRRRPLAARVRAVARLLRKVTA